MSALRVSADVLRANAAALALAAPIPPHHRAAYAVFARAMPGSGIDLLTEGDRWFLDSILRLPALTERQQARLNAMATKVERGQR